MLPNSLELLHLNRKKLSLCKVLIEFIYIPLLIVIWYILEAFLGVVVRALTVHEGQRRSRVQIPVPRKNSFGSMDVL